MSGSYVGGKRDRLIIDNLRNHIVNGLDALGWFDVGRPHRSVTVLSQPVGQDEQLQPNIISISEEDLSETEVELGSHLSDFRWTFAVDVYAENAALGRHLTGDVRGLLTGRFSSIGYNSPTLDVYDLTLATPIVIFRCELGDIVYGRQRNYSRSFEKYWWTIMFDVVDSYMNEDA
jgi:hypothetical protein